MPEILSLHAGGAPGKEQRASLIDAPAPAANTRDEHAAYDAVATQVQRENEVLHFRLTWTLQLNGFLFTAVAILGPRDPLTGVLRLLVHWLIPITGTCVSLAGLLGVVAAHMQVLYLRRFWTDLRLQDRPRPFGDAHNAFILGAVPAVLPPAVLAAVWIGFGAASLILR